MFNDAAELGKALNASNVSVTLKRGAGAIADAFVQYAGGLALNKVSQTSVPAAQGGVLTLFASGTALLIDLSSDTWQNANNGKAPDVIVGHDELLNSVFDV